jgi:hypothetical protein
MKKKYLFWVCAVIIIGILLALYYIPVKPMGLLQVRDKRTGEVNTKQVWFSILKSREELIVGKCKGTVTETILDIQDMVDWRDTAYDVSLTGEDIRNITKIITSPSGYCELYWNIL